MEEKHLRKALRALWLVCAVGCLTMGCRHTSHPAPTPQTPSATMAAAPTDSAKASLPNLQTVEDTTVGGWRIISQAANNKLKIKGTDQFDLSLFVTIYKDGHLLFNRKELTKPSLLGYADPTLMLIPSSVWLITNTSVYLFTGAYEPETDNGYSIILAFSKDGSFKAYPFAPSLDYADLATEFYTIYLHELQQKDVDDASVRKVVKNYLTSRMAQRLDKAGWHSILPPKVAALPLANIEASGDCIGEQEGDGYLYGRVFFYERGNRTPIDSLQFSMMGEKNEYGGLDYNQIDDIMPYPTSKPH